MGKKKVSAPPPPDPNQVAKAQTDSNIATANFNANLNRVNTVNPFASQTYSSTTDANGNPQWTSTTSLSPQMQGLYDTAASPFQFQGLGDMPNTPDVMGNAPSTPDVMGSMSQGDINAQLQQGLGDMPSMDNGGREAVTNSLMQLMQPQIDRDRESQRAALANQGITMGSQPWQSAQQAQGDNENRLRLNAVLAGGQEQSRLFGLGMAGRQQRYGENLGGLQGYLGANQQRFGQQNANFANSLNADQQRFGQQNAAFQDALQRRGQMAGEQVTARNLPFANMQAVYGMTPQAQIATAQAGPTDIGGYTYGSYAGQQNNYNQQVAQNNAITSGLFGLGGSGIMGYSLMNKK
jgi:hypothetical protein